MAELGKIIKQLREKHNKTQSELALACAVEVKTIGRIERNEVKNVSPSTMQGLLSVFNDSEDQKLLTSISSMDISVKKLTEDKNTIILTEVTDANIILNNVCKGFIDLTGQLTGDRMSSSYDAFICMSYKNVKSWDGTKSALEAIKEFFDTIKKYRQNYNEIISGAIGPDTEFHNYNYPNELTDLKLETSFVLSEHINTLRGFGKRSYWQHDHNQDGELINKDLIEEIDCDLSVFANFNGFVKPHSGDADRCPIIYVCDTKNNSSVSQKNKKDRILRINKEEILPKHPPYNTYQPFLKHDDGIPF